jgi:2-succinyl-5-enolpyruvyl-6-hydroxy-3-cyclohexene-1-carboxylate synthase
MVSSDKLAVQLIVEQCVTHGMRHVVCSPGSRNAPFVIAFDEHPLVNCMVIHDERSAAFFALGMAQQLGQPVGIVCTSGSAALNYFPAIAEAYYQCVPLVAITADRPDAWINQGDGQTIMQANVFGKHVKYACHFSDSMHSSEEKWFIQREIARAFVEGNTNWKGPIHLNVALTEPLYGNSEVVKIQPRTLEVIQGVFQFSSEHALFCESSLTHFSKILVICGQMNPDFELLNQLKLFAENTSVAVLVENTSNLVDNQFNHCIDRSLQVMEGANLETYTPDLLITIGGAVVSKKIKTFLRTNPPKQHWKIGCEFPFMDTYQCLSHSFTTHPVGFFRAINKLKYLKNHSNFGPTWKQLDFLAQDKLPAFFEHVAFSDIQVYDIILDFLPEGTHLHMANSSVVRYCQLFDPIKSVTYWSNRGTSGIDGSSSTACGAAASNPKDLHVLITGDVSFFYDSNAFWNAHLTPNLRIIMIHNGGGGIFKIIPGPATSKQLHTYFEAKHAYSAKSIAAAFEITYFSAHSSEEIENQMEAFYHYEEDGKPKLLEIFTDSELNPEKLNDFFKSVSQHR